MSEITVPVSPGELLDKITILRIKSQRITDAAKLKNVRHELDSLQRTWAGSSYARIDIEAETHAFRPRYRCGHSWSRPRSAAGNRAHDARS